MITKMGFETKPETRGILYLCEYDHEFKTIEVVNERQYASTGDALNAYANIPNPESQIATGGTREEFEQDLKKLHTRLDNPQWVRELAGYL